MPGMNGTGPYGDGPGTGLGRGRCGGGPGLGLCFGRMGGRGAGRGHARFAVGYGPIASPAQEELRGALEARRSFLGAELARVEALLATAVNAEPKAGESGATK